VAPGETLMPLGNASTVNPDDVSMALAWLTTFNVELNTSMNTVDGVLALAPTRLSRTPLKQPATLEEKRKPSRGAVMSVASAPADELVSRYELQPEGEVVAAAEVV
jgi:hypothetical protein